MPKYMIMITTLLLFLSSYIWIFFFLNMGHAIYMMQWHVLIFMSVKVAGVV